MGSYLYYMDNINAAWFFGDYLAFMCLARASWHESLEPCKRRASSARPMSAISVFLSEAVSVITAMLITGGESSSTLFIRT